MLNTGASATREDLPVVALDPSGSDHHGEAARLRELGPVVRVLLPGGVYAWAVTRYSELAALVNDPRVSKDWRHWTAIRSGEIPEGWPLDGMVRVTNMVTADGTEHHRLRRLVTKTLTQRRVQDMRPGISQIVENLLDALPSHAAPDGTVDIRQHFACPVPMQVICELTGVPEPWRPRLRELVDSIFRTDTTPDEVIATQRDRRQMLADLVDLRRQEPSGDLTSALACYSATGRDERQFGEGACRYDTSQASSRHLAFGGGTHFCVGVSLARLEGVVALRGLFTRYPDISLAADPATLPPVPSLFSNSARMLPVWLGGPG